MTDQYADICEECMKLDEVTIYELWDKKGVRRACPHRPLQ